MESEITALNKRPQGVRNLPGISHHGRADKTTLYSSISKNFSLNVL
jgi:hypothetical protein